MRRWGHPNILGVELYHLTEWDTRIIYSTRHVTIEGLILILVAASLTCQTSFKVRGPIDIMTICAALTAHGKPSFIIVKSFDFQIWDIITLKLFSVEDIASIGNVGPHLSLWSYCIYAVPVSCYHTCSSLILLRHIHLDCTSFLPSKRHSGTMVGVLYKDLAIENSCLWRFAESIRRDESRIWSVNRSLSTRHGV